MTVVVVVAMFKEKAKSMIQRDGEKEEERKMIEEEEWQCLMNE